MKTITYSINDSSDDSGDGADIILNNPEILAQMASQMQTIITMHEELRKLKVNLDSDLHLSWSGDGKNSFDNYMDFAQKFLNDLVNPLAEFKSVIQGVGSILGELNGSDPKVKSTAEGVQIP